MSNCVPAKSSNFKLPYSVVQKFTTGPCGTSVAISLSCAEYWGVLKNKKILAEPDSPSSLPILMYYKSYLSIDQCQYNAARHAGDQDPGLPPHLHPPVDQWRPASAPEQSHGSPCWSRQSGIISGISLYGEMERAIAFKLVS